MSTKKCGIRWFVVTLALLLPASLAAQQSIEERSIEVGAAAGVSSGMGSVDKFTDISGLLSDLTSVSAGPVTFDPGSKTKWNIGVSGGYAIRPMFMAVAEIVRTRLANPSINLRVGPVGTSVGFDSSLLEFNAGLQVHIPVRESRIVPFAGAGLGVARTTLNVKESTFNVLNPNVSDTHFEEYLGGGARVYLVEHLGIKPEFKIVHIPNETFVRTGIGLFYQFGS